MGMCTIGFCVCVCLFVCMFCTIDTTVSQMLGKCTTNQFIFRPLSFFYVFILRQDFIKLSKQALNSLRSLHRPETDNLHAFISNVVGITLSCAMRPSRSSS